MKKLLVLSLASVLSMGAFAEDMPPAPSDAPKGEFAHHGPKGFGMMSKLTDEQKACIEKFGCKMPEKPEMGDKGAMPPMGEKPDMKKRPEMTEEQKENMECMRKAMESCGIEMPKHEERGPRGQKKPVSVKESIPE